MLIRLATTSLFIFKELLLFTKIAQYDSLILDSFNQIDSAIQEYYWQEGKLPSDLEILKTDYGYIMDKTLTDPTTNGKYEYKIVEDNKYELCATFRTDNTTDTHEDISYSYKDRWPHASGHQCLSQNVKSRVESGMDVKPVPVQ